MTIITTQSRITYAGDNVTTVFPIPFEFFLNGDLTVAKTAVGGAVSTLTLNIDYTLTGANVPAGGSLTKTTALLTGEIMAIFLNPPINQQSHYISNSPFPSATLENDIDRQTQISQRLQDQISRSVRAPDADATPGMVLPPAALRALMYQAFDASGNVIAVPALPGSAITQQSLGIVLYPQSAAEISAGVVPTLYVYPVGHLLRYGADATGVASSWNAFNKAVAVCKLTGSTIIVPAGNFLIDTVNGTINLSYVTILGTGVTDGAANPAAAGSVLSITGTVNTPFTVGPGVTFDGIGFFYPAQVDSFTPIVFPPTINVTLAIAGSVNFVYIQNCTVFNAYRFYVDAVTGTGAEGHVWFLDNTIYGILTCFEIAYNPEIMTWAGNEFTFGHYLAATEAGLRKFTRQNGTVILIPRTDGISFNSNVMLGYLNGIAFTTVATGLCQLCSITQNYFDQVLFPIIATGAGNISGMTITANSFVPYNSQLTTAIGNAIKIATTGLGAGAASEQITISANNFSTCTGDEINTSGAANRTLTINGNQFLAWGQFQAAGTYGALNIGGSGTSYVASGNSFINQANTPAVASGIIGTAVDAIISNNIFSNCNAPINVSLNAAVVTGNLSFGTISAASNTYAFFNNIMDANNFWDKNAFKTPSQLPIAQYGNYANDAAAAAGGVAAGGMYRNGSVVQVRVV